MSKIDVNAKTNPHVKASQDYMSGKSKSQNPVQYTLEKLLNKDSDK